MGGGGDAVAEVLFRTRERNGLTDSCKTRIEDSTKVTNGFFHVIEQLEEAETDLDNFFTLKSIQKNGACNMAVQGMKVRFPYSSSSKETIGSSAKFQEQINKTENAASKIKDKKWGAKGITGKIAAAAVEWKKVEWFRNVKVPKACGFTLQCKKKNAEGNVVEGSWEKEGDEVICKI